MGERDGGGSEIERRACKYCGKVLSESVAIPIEQRSHVREVVIEKFWRPCCKTAYVWVSKRGHFRTGVG